MLEFNIDAYGGVVRASYLADYFEYRSTGDGAYTLSMLADEVIDNGWGKKDLDISMSGDDFNEFYVGSVADDTPELVVRVREILAERSKVLGRRYPFIIMNDSAATILRLKQRDEVELDFSYLGFLSVSLAHGADIKVSGLSSPTVEDSMEAMAAEVLNDCGLISKVVPTYGKPLDEKVLEISGELNLMCWPAKAPQSKYAKDGGTDIISCFPATDVRKYPGVLLIGQVTCGKSETWQSKAAQPRVPFWRMITLMNYDPIRFLAVPHDVDKSCWSHVSQSCACVLFDRIRLVSMAKKVSNDAEIVVREVLGLANWT